MARLKANDLRTMLEGNPALLRRNQHLNATALPAGLEHFPRPAITQQVAESKDVQKLNKTERAFLEYLRREHRWIGVQCLTLKLGDDCRYTPDLWTHGSDGFTAWEVKGFWRDDAKVKIKVAARIYPMIRFIVVSKDRDGWTQLEIQR